MTQKDRTGSPSTPGHEQQTLFWIFDLQTPHNEDEYQDSLRIVKMLRNMANK